MNLTNQKGFTIVELLIVVVVIAILAAISIVAYTGITNRANKSAAMEAANAVKSVATTFSGTNGAYPTTRAQFVAGHNGDANNAIAKLPSDICFINTPPSAAPVSNDCTGSGMAAGRGPKTVAVEYLGSSSAPTGLEIHYWEYDGAKSMVIGTGARLATRAFIPN